MPRLCMVDNLIDSIIVKNTLHEKITYLLWYIIALYTFNTLVFLSNYLTSLSINFYGLWMYIFV